MRSLSAATVAGAAFFMLGGCALAPTESQDMYATMAAQTVKLEMADGHGHGSGVIVSPLYILTAAHVPDDAGGSMDVKFTDGTKAVASLAWEDKGRDIALMRLDRPTTLPPATLSREPVRIGEEIWAVGYPLILPLSIQHGHVASALSALTDFPAEYRADNKDLAAVIVLDCVIVPGDSGGPVFNANGDVVGINDLQFKEPQGDGISGLSGMVGTQFIRGDVLHVVGI